jgi:hypothetical protein
MPFNTDQITQFNISICPIPVAAQSKEWVCGHSLAATAGSNPVGVSYVSFEDRVFSGTCVCVRPITCPECGVCDYDTEPLIMRWPWAERGCCAIRKIWIWEYIRTGIVRINSCLSLRDHRQFTDLVQHVGLSWMFKVLFVDLRTVIGLNGVKLQYSCSDKMYM